MRRRKCLNPFFIGCMALALLVGGCGGDDEKAATTDGATAEQSSETATATSGSEAEPTETETEAETETLSTETSPEDQAGGAGDEEPAYSPALFTGRGGHIRPRVIRVPAFISIRVELRSADGGEYGLDFGGKTLKVEGALSSVSTTLDGMRAGDSVLGRPIGAGNDVRIEANAEPGP